MLGQYTTFHDLLQQMDALRRQVDRAYTGELPDAAAGFPPVNIFTTETGVMVTAEIPGVDPQDISISAYQDTLTIKGERHIAKPNENQAWHRRERAEGGFARTIQLPYAIDADSVQAKAKDGVLAIAVARPEEDRPKKIAVEVA
jgi:HSP20 family protein